MYMLDPQSYSSVNQFYLFSELQTDLHSRQRIILKSTQRLMKKFAVALAKATTR